MSTTQDLWKQFGDERRQQATLAFLKDDSLGEFHSVANSYIAKTRNFRAQFVKKLPVEKRAQYLAHLPLPPDMQSQMIISYFFATQRPMMADFLDALNIPNDNGLIKEDHEPSAPAPEVLKAAVERLREKYAADEVELYLQALLLQSEEVWGGLKQFVADGS
jgi:hypothetical protein